MSEYDVDVVDNEKVLTYDEVREYLDEVEDIGYKVKDSELIVFTLPDDGYPGFCAIEDLDNVETEDGILELIEKAEDAKREVGEFVSQNCKEGTLELEFVPGVAYDSIVDIALEMGAEKVTTYSGEPVLVMPDKPVDIYSKEEDEYKEGLLGRADTNIEDVSAQINKLESLSDQDLSTLFDRLEVVEELLEVLKVDYDADYIDSFQLEQDQLAKYIQVHADKMVVIYETCPEFDPNRRHYRTTRETPISSRLAAALINTLNRLDG